MASTPKQRFLEAFDREHATTMRVLRAFPKEKADFKPSDNLRSARDLAWVFALESGMGVKGWNDEFAKGVPSGAPPQAPQTWDQLLDGVEKAHNGFRDVVSS